jgi:hypothetical protein
VKCEKTTEVGDQKRTFSVGAGLFHGSFSAVLGELAFKHANTRAFGEGVSALL